MQSGFLPVNGINMYYEIYGTGKPMLVLIHGGGSTIQTTFANIIPLLEKNYTLVAMDLQAHGRTTDRGVASSFEQDADDVAALLQQLNISKASFLGFSNGGNTAMQVAVRHPRLVEKLIIASSFYQREGLFAGFFDFMKGASLDNMPKQLQEEFLKLTPDEDKLLIMHDRDKNRMLAFTDWSDDVLRSIKVPVLLLAGDKDVMTQEHLIKMAGLFPDARLAVLPGTHGTYLGEITAHLEDSKQVQMTAWLTDEFLAGRK